MVATSFLTRALFAGLIGVAVAGGADISAAGLLFAATPVPTPRIAEVLPAQPNVVSTIAPQSTPTPPAPLPPSATPTASPTPTRTATATPLPPTPTASSLTPAPTGYFVPSYRGLVQAAGLETSVIRGQVLDYRGFGIPNVPINLAGNNLSLETACGVDGGFAFGGLKPAQYNVSVGGFPGEPASSIFAMAGHLVTVDFVEAERSVDRSTTPVAASANPTGEVATKGEPAVMIVVLTPEGGGAIRPTATPRPTTTAIGLNLVPRWDSPLQALVTGAVGACLIAALGIVVVGFRR